MEKTSKAPTTSSEYVVNGKRYVVVSHYVGTKDINKVIRENAMRTVLAEIKKSA